MADWYGTMRKTTNGCNIRSTIDEDFDEEEMWCYEEEKEDSGPAPRKPSDYSSTAWRLPSAPRMVPRVSQYSSSAKHETKMAQQSSAPLNIPDWSKIYGRHGSLDSSRNGRWDYNGDNGCGEDHDDDHDMVPPHEWLAKKLARSQISSFSVCEGIGRTLKGRDLSKVRNAVLTKTGFLE
ncbi:hypothetical protein ERO13_A05G170500v2 [Gossypium hirsutum]|uniref:Uncharacterized protein LOC107958273 n=4 Tax=Gossypium TaxID=3633 RepID=A0A1U8PGZ8_GOSHI|nr:uncharacterized protein LOC107958273 [Gossypium hirsutum]XP_040969595.1 uncharacterized protein LOC107958273 [Gossypium hirsutum]KAB2082147.1 hypothetical protein ES319_A05G178900v1 [Gossypium barbadense]TYH17317.1 hypothetical protein ES288_A05G182700v1 [Gossypium darwinii]TYI27555.1 hypothetical protein ES332_A05G185100v1 [Gossypium tomentosum]KAB2082148.1 hypothetical protein ES319_A05G178900v1 [Gossypium barbadense]KAG4199822.1 hypothetical protein ERO13_A05G170500v2 [Gossypium hirsutu